MIRYSLKCSSGHEFEAWFRSSADFDAQRSAGHVACAICASPEVEKAVMAPAVAAPAREAGPEPALSRPASPAEAALQEMRRHVERNSDYVGRDFAQEARRIHEGEADRRSIWGEASPGEAKALKEDGIPVAPIPWMRRGNA